MALMADGLHMSTHTGALGSSAQGRAEPCAWGSTAAYFGRRPAHTWTMKAQGLSDDDDGAHDHRSVVPRPSWLLALSRR